MCEKALAIRFVCEDDIFIHFSEAYLPPGANLVLVVLISLIAGVVIIICIFTKLISLIN